MRKFFILMVIGLSYSEELNYSDESYRYRLVTPYSGATCKALRTLIINIFGPMKGVFRVFSPRTSRIRVAASPKTLFFGSDARFLYEGNRIRIGATVF